MTGGPDHTERRRVGALSQRFGGRDDCAAGEPGGRQAARTHDGVGIEPTATTPVDGDHMIEEGAIVDPQYLVVADRPRHGSIDRIDDAGVLDALHRRSQPVGTFWVVGAGDMFQAPLIAQDQQHTAERTAPTRARIVKPRWGCTH